MTIKSDYYFKDYRLPKFYDCIYNKVTHDLEFWKKSVEGKKDILELACGTGRVTFEISNENNIIDALDFSQEMLDQFFSKLDSRINKGSIKITRGDMRQFKFPKKYDVILITSNSLNHIEENADVDRVFECVKQHLKPDGILVFDILNPIFKFYDRPENGKYHETIHKFNDSNYFKVWENNKYNYATQVNKVNYYYQFCEKNGKAVSDKVYEQSINVRLFYPQEMDYIIKSNGFKIEQKYSDYNQLSFNGKTGCQIYILKLSESNNYDK